MRLRCISGGGKCRRVSVCAVWLSHSKWLSKWSNVKFCIKLGHSSMETIWMIQKATAMGNRQLAASSQQCARLCITTCAEFFWWNIKSPRWLSPLQPRFGTLQLLAYPKTKITFEKKEILDGQWDSGKYNRVADGDWENCVMSQGAYFEGDWGIIVLCTMFPVSCVFFNECLFFILHGWIPSGETSYITLCLSIPLSRNTWVLKPNS